MNRRHFVAALAGSVLGLDAVRSARASALEKLEIYIPAPVGSGWDQTGRAMAACLRDDGIVPDTVLANGTVGGEAAIGRFIDSEKGRTDAVMLTGLGMIGVLALGNAKLDLGSVTPIARLIAEYEAIAVPVDSAYASFSTLMSTLRTNPSSIRWVGGSAGGTDHILAVLVGKALGLSGKDIVYRGMPGGAGAIDEVLAGRANCVVSTWSELEPQVSAGRLKAVAISAPQRIPGVNVQTLIERGIDIELGNWRGVFAPPGITAAERDALIDIVARLVGTLSWKAKLFERNWTGAYLAGDAFAAFVHDETRRVRGVLGDLGLN